MGCKTQWNQTKFERVKKFKAKFCIDAEKDYSLQGNFNNKEFKMISI